MHHGGGCLGGVGVRLGVVGWDGVAIVRMSTIFPISTYKTKVS